VLSLQPLMGFELLLYPLSGAFTGALTGFIFAKFAVNSINGKGKTRLADELASFITSRLPDVSGVLDKVATPESFLALMPVIESHIDDFLRNRLKIAIPMIGMMIGERTIAQLKAVFMDELKLIFPLVVRQYVLSAAGNFDLRSEIRDQLLSVPSARVLSFISPVITRYSLLAGLIIGVTTGVINLLIHILLTG